MKTESIMQAVLKAVPVTVILMTVVMLPQLGLASETRTGNNWAPEAGTQYMQFYVLNGVGSYESPGFSLYYGRQLSANRSLRLGMDFDVSASTGSSTSIGMNDTIQYRDNSSDDDRHYYRINGSLQYMMQLKRTGNVAVYLGIGPSVLYSNVVDRATYTSDLNPEGEYQHNNRTADALEVGLANNLGTQWFFTDNMSLNAELGLQFTYTFYDDLEENYWSQDNSWENDLYENDGWSLYLNRVKIGLTYYF